MLPSVIAGRTLTTGAPSERATPATVRGCWLALKSSIARATFMSAFVGIAWTTRSCAVDGGSGGACSAAGARSRLGREVRRRHSGVRVLLDRLDAGPRRPRARQLDALVAPALAQALEERGAARRATSRATRPGAASAPSRIQPSWAARGAHSSQTWRRSPAARNDVGLLAAQQRRPQTSQATSRLRSRSDAECHRPQGSRWPSPSAPAPVERGCGYAAARASLVAGLATTFCARCPGTSS